MAEGLLYTHSRLNANTGKTLEVASFLYALIELLEEKGLISIETLDERKRVVGERLRVYVQLIDAATDEHLWAERYDRTLDDAFAIQSEVAQRIVEAVGATLTGGSA